MEIKLSLICNATLRANATGFLLILFVGFCGFFWLVQGFFVLFIAVLGQGLMTRKLVLAGEYVKT